MVWDFTAYDFLDPDLRTRMPSVNGSLHRQGELTAIAGLFQVTSCREYRIYQVRGYDLSNMTIIEHDSGLVIIDPLASYETVQAALQLFRDKTELSKEQRPVKALIYTHCHVDHFGGARGIFHELGDPLEPGVPVVAPEGFLEHAVSENIYAGPAMARRAQYMYAAQLDKGPMGQVGSGLGLTISTGEVTLIPPTVYIGGSDHQPVPKENWKSSHVIPWRPGLHVFDGFGFPLVFQLTPGTEAPTEMNIYFPDARTLCIAENATHTMHNILSLRGAQVRDAHAWSKYLTEAIQTFGKETDVLFGEEGLRAFLGGGMAAALVPLIASRDRTPMTVTVDSGGNRRTVSSVHHPCTGDVAHAAQGTWKDPARSDHPDTGKHIMRRITTVLLGVAAILGILSAPASADDAPWSRLVSVSANAAGADPWHPGAPEHNGLIVLP
ncbi:MBL fold metallo-hydrolase [Streptomyces triculaminicus]|uniref:MBL fold metallo-hydrolase n=1 Tax=Streptomyces triculaminicus TaxID=2816232 RepID=UPI0037938A93